MHERLEQKQRTRRNLIEAALKLSGEQGFSSISLREVAKVAGITPAGFYRHFHDMEELGLALIDEVGLSLRHLLREARRNIDKEGSAVRSSVETFIEYITENANLFRLLQGERQGSSLAFRKALFAEINRFIEEVTEDLDRGSKLLDQPLMDVGLAAEAIVAVAFTVGAEAIDLPKHRRQELIERLIKEVKMILRGARIQERPKKKVSKKSSRRKSQR
ncbi:HTH-type transcriptional repressor FabR [Peredibacter starrii]|uniref:HTH-type transcriptional repressor FabR n=1 Tax=Peredibacter starrii TaxID=28202 RepID=A0AAX4HLZ1_9BACT|nr:HTH-type transcriptional repressor FabR [Peredibacter starrii]WPU64143.1 HTH-type transcriptional repressor FabR [Peredibacter starrii]